jgi:hypothetical protein
LKCSELPDIPAFPVWVERYIRDHGIRTDYRFTDVPREKLSQFEGRERLHRIVLPGTPRTEKRA